MGDPRGRADHQGDADIVAVLRGALTYLEAAEARARQDLATAAQRRGEHDFMIGCLEGELRDELAVRADTFPSDFDRLTVRLGEIMHSREILQRELAREEAAVSEGPPAGESRRVIPLRVAPAAPRDDRRWTEDSWEGGQPSAAEAAVAIMQRHPGQPLRVRQIVSAIQSEGWLGDYADPRNAVTSALNRLKNDSTAPVESPCRGYFQWVAP